MHARLGPIRSSCNLLISNVDFEDASANDTDTQLDRSIKDGKPAHEVLPNPAPWPTGSPTLSPEEPVCAASSATVTTELPVQGTFEAHLFNTLESGSDISVQPEGPISEDSSEVSTTPSLIPINEAPRPVADLAELSASRLPVPDARDSPLGDVGPLVHSRFSSPSGLDDGPDEAAQLPVDDPILENFLTGHRLQPSPTVNQSSETPVMPARSRDLTAVPPTSTTGGFMAGALRVYSRSHIYTRPPSYLQGSICHRYPNAGSSSTLEDSQAN